MEKNGNTFVPGDKVSAHTNTKTSSRRTGRVCPEGNDGKIKVAWDDGTTTWESPDELDREG